MATKRAREIQEIISDLELLKRDSKYREAAEINIGFFKAARSLFCFIHWLISVAPKLRRRRERLLELADLPLKKWQRKTHQGLIKYQSGKFTGRMVTAFIEELCRILLTIKETKSSQPIVVFDLGFGGGELGRQVFKRLPDVSLVYVGIDISPAVMETAKQAFQPLHEKGEIIFKELPILDDEVVEALGREASATCKKVVAVWCGNILTLDKHLSPGKIDIIWHARVFHHLSSADKARLVDICRQLSPVTVEMDDRNCFWLKFWAMVTTWLTHPDVALMNGAFLSCLRVPAKEELTGYFKLVPPFSYIRLIFGQDIYPQGGEWQTATQTLVTGFSFKD
jgi:SAM-dependent methyltransferase